MTRKLAWIALVCLLVWPLAWSPSALAQGPTPGRVRFLVTGDVHYGGPVDDCTQNPTEDLLNDAHMQALIGRMLASDYDIRGIMIVGDMITGGDSYAAGGSDPWSACLSKQDQWAAYQAARGGYSQYFYDGWGNHEMYGEGDTGPVETLLMYDLVNHGRATPINRGTYHYSWDWEGIHFVQLNVCVSNADCDSGRVDPQSALSWLASDLVSQVGTSGRPVVLFYHMPFTSTPEESHTWFVDNILSNYNVIASFAGHNHPGAGIIGCKYLDDLTSCNTSGNPTLNEPVELWTGQSEVHLSVTIEDCELAAKLFEFDEATGEYVDAGISIKVPFDAPDDSAPTTSAALSGTLGDNGWYQSDVQVTLTAEDEGCAGIAQTRYQIDGGTWQTYGSPFSVSGSGSHTVYYRSKDNDGNWESQQQIAFSIDEIVPTGSLTLNDGTATTPGVLVWLAASASDAHSGVVQVRLRNAGDAWGNWQSFASGSILWQLSSSPVTGQSYAVEAEFQDRAGQVSATVSDTIRLDVQPARPSSASYRLVKSTWGTSGTGGTTSGSSSSYIRYDTLGQTSIGPYSSSHMSLGAGYWSGTAPATAVTLHSFAAAAQEGAIVLTWETALEVDVLGFHVYRAASPDAEPTRLTPTLLPAHQTGGTGGSAYTYVDETAAPGVAYTYWLEVVDTGGETARYGPVSATLPPAAPHHLYLPLVLR